MVTVNKLVDSTVHSDGYIPMMILDCRSYLLMVTVMVTVI